MASTMKAPIPCSEIGDEFINNSEIRKDTYLSTPFLRIPFGFSR